MPRTRRLALVPLVCALVLAAGQPVAQASERSLPETVTVHDSRTSPPLVDVSKVVLNSSWYYDSEQYVRVKVPHGFRAGHRLTVWFDVDGDSTPDGHFDLRLKEPKKPGGKLLRKVQEFRLGGGWGLGGELVRCTGSDDFQPASTEIKGGQRTVALALDLWWCVKRSSPTDLTSASWRAAVRVAKGKVSDMAPNGRRWSKPVAGWSPCPPGDC